MQRRSFVGALIATLLSPLLVSGSTESRRRRIVWTFWRSKLTVCFNSEEASAEVVGSVRDLVRFHRAWRGYSLEEWREVYGSKAAAKEIANVTTRANRDGRLTYECELAYAGTWRKSIYDYTRESHVKAVWAAIFDAQSHGVDVVVLNGAIMRTPSSAGESGQSKQTIVGCKRWTCTEVEERFGLPRGLLKQRGIEVAIQG